MRPCCMESQAPGAEVRGTKPEEAGGYDGGGMGGAEGKRTRPGG